MSDTIEIRIDTNAAAIVARMKRFPAEMLAAIARALDRENELTVGYIQSQKLSRRGPETLGVVTNRLRSSVRPSRARIVEGGVESAIGSNVRYAGVHEFGFRGTVNVREHKRRIIAFDRYERIRGRLVQTQAGIRGTVRAHAMRMNIRERAPFRRSIAERTSSYRAAVSAAILTSWQGEGTS